MEASVSADDRTLEPGEWTNVTYRLENRGDATFVYQHPGCPPARVGGAAEGPGPDVDLYAYRDESRAGTCMIRNVSIAPGEAVSATVNWNGRQEADPPDPHGGDRVPAGTYTVTVELVRSDPGPVHPADVTVEVRD